MFLTRLKAESAPRGRWKLIAPLDYLADQCFIRVPVGFETDLASIPKGLRWIISQNEEHREAAVLHDYLYSVGGKFDWFSFTRKEADEIFLAAMNYSGVSWLKRSLMFSAVRSFGWYFWSEL